jgi:hypothetical protein
LRARRAGKRAIYGFMRRSCPEARGRQLGRKAGAGETPQVFFCGTSGGAASEARIAQCRAAPILSPRPPIFLGFRPESVALRRARPKASEK